MTTENNEERHHKKVPHDEYFTKHPGPHPGLPMSFPFQDFSQVNLNTFPIDLSHFLLDINKYNQLFPTP